MALIAASLMCWGVEKCGSPAPNSTRSAPPAFSLAASATTAMVALISMRFTRSLNCFTAGTVAICYLTSLCGRGAMEFIPQPLLHQLRHQPAHGAAKAKNLFDQPRAQVRVGLGWHHENSFQLRLQLAVHQRHLQFVFVVTDGADASQHCLRFFLQDRKSTRLNSSH